MRPVLSARIALGSDRQQPPAVGDRLRQLVEILVEADGLIAGRELRRAVDHPLSDLGGTVDRLGDDLLLLVDRIPDGAGAAQARQNDRDGRYQYQSTAQAGRSPLGAIALVLFLDLQPDGSIDLADRFQHRLAGTQAADHHGPFRHVVVAADGHGPAAALLAGGGRAIQFEAEGERAQPHLVLVLQPDRADLVTIDIDAIGAVQVLDAPGALAGEEPGVLARQLARSHHEGARVPTPDRHVLAALQGHDDFAFAAIDLGWIEADQAAIGIGGLLGRSRIRLAGILPAVVAHHNGSIFVRFGHHSAGDPGQGNMETSGSRLAFCVTPIRPPANMPKSSFLSNRNGNY